MSKAHVVVVNDDPIQLRQLAGVLQAVGHEVSAYLDAADALAGVAGRPDVHLFVVDLHMPGIDGWKLCRLLRSPELSRFNETPILVVSATFTGDDVASITAELGANAFLEAPFEASVLQGYAQSLLEGKRPKTELSVLIVEDDASVRDTLGKAFAAHGFAVFDAATASEARSSWKERQADVVLLDYHLPDGSCEELIEDFKGPANRTCTLVMTGDTDPALPVRLLARGADGYLRKPFDPVFAVELAGNARRQRSLLRIETILESRTRELRASEERYRSLFETIPDTVVVIDDRGHIVQVNPDGLRFLEVDESEILGRHVLEMVRPEEARTFSRWLDSVGSGPPQSIETELSKGDGGAFPVELSGRPVEFKGSPALLLVGRDLTDRRAAEEERRRIEGQMQHAQRLESLGVLAGGVAHDFNNLLVGILGNASLVLMDLSDISPMRDAIHQIELAARRAAELTQQILAFAGKSKVSTQDLNLSDVVREMGQLLEPAVSKKARLSYRLPAALAMVKGDAGQLRQVVMNLIINASDALEGQPGTIRISTSLADLEASNLPDTVGATRPEPGRYVALEVADDGCGMDEKTLSRIFEPFFSTKFHGRGLGLAATLGIVQAHKGHLAVESKPGQGAKITVFLPPHEMAGTGDAAQGGQGAQGWWTGGGSVLVVDDEPAVRGLARAALSRHGFEVNEAADGARGLDALSNGCASVDLVILDVTMPELDGVEALSLLRQQRPDIPVLLSSGYPPEEIMESADDSGPLRFLQKPYSPADLMDAVSELLRLACRRDKVTRGDEQVI